MSRAAELISGLSLIPGALPVSESTVDEGTGYKCSSKYIVDSRDGKVFGLDLNMMSFKDGWAEIEKYHDQKDHLVLLYKDEGGLWNETDVNGPTGTVSSIKVQESLSEAVDKKGTPILAGLRVNSPAGEGKVNLRSGDVFVIQIGEESHEFSGNELDVLDIPSTDADGVPNTNTAAVGAPGHELTRD